MKSLPLLFACVISAPLGCSKKDEADKPSADKSAPSTKGDKDQGTPSSTNRQEPAATETAEEPVEPPAPEGLALLEFPNTGLDAEVGQYVFSPNDSSFQSAHEGEERERGTFSWGVMKVVSKGEAESEVKSMMGQYTMPNAYLLPIPASEVAAGDIRREERRHCDGGLGHPALYGRHVKTIDKKLGHYDERLTARSSGWVA